MDPLAKRVSARGEGGDREAQCTKETQMRKKSPGIRLRKTEDERLPMNYSLVLICIGAAHAEETRKSKEMNDRLSRTAERFACLRGSKCGQEED